LGKFDSIPKIDVLVIQVVFLPFHHPYHHPITLHVIGHYDVIQGKFKLQILHKKLSVFFLNYQEKFSSKALREAFSSRTSLRVGLEHQRKNHNKFLLVLISMFEISSIINVWDSTVKLLSFTTTKTKNLLS
jgi:hypothetical protein